MTIKPIETVYKGYKFRSRLEARWAVFFDELGIGYEYEPEGFDLGAAGWYLPDFKVRAPNGYTYWYEIKPEGVTTDDKLLAFSAALDSPNTDAECNAIAGTAEAVLLSGDPMSYLESLNKGDFDGVCPRCGFIGPSAYGSYDSGQDGFEYGCQYCDFTTPGGGGHAREKGLLSVVRPHKGHLILSKSAFTKYRGKVTLAANKARQARFEHLHKAA